MDGRNGENGLFSPFVFYSYFRADAIGFDLLQLSRSPAERKKRIALPRRLLSALERCLVAIGIKAIRGANWDVGEAVILFTFHLSHSVIYNGVLVAR